MLNLLLLITRKCPTRERGEKASWCLRGWSRDSGLKGGGGMEVYGHPTEPAMAPETLAALTTSEVVAKTTEHGIRSGVDFTRDGGYPAVAARTPHMDRSRTQDPGIGRRVCYPSRGRAGCMLCRIHLFGHSFTCGSLKPKLLRVGNISRQIVSERKCESRQAGSWRSLARRHDQSMLFFCSWRCML